MANLAIGFATAGLVAVNVPVGSSDRIRFGRLGGWEEMAIARAIEGLGAFRRESKYQMLMKSRDLIDCLVSPGSPVDARSAP